jgi:hypothetical protein
MSNFESYHNEFHVDGEPDIRKYICEKTGNEARAHGGGTGDRETERWADMLRKQAANTGGDDQLSITAEKDNSTDGARGKNGENAKND